MKYWLVSGDLRRSSTCLASYKKCEWVIGDNGLSEFDSHHHHYEYRDNNE
jgi:hypothetical protein